MRKLSWLTLGFGAGCGLCAYWQSQPAWVLPLMLLGGILVFKAEESSLRKKAAFLVFGISLGIFWFSRFEERNLEPLYDLDGVTREASIRFSGYGEETDYGIRAEGRILLGGKNYGLMVYLDGEAAVEPGTVLSGPFRFQATAPGGEKASSYYQGEGIFLLAYQEDGLTAAADDTSWRDFSGILRQKILDILEASLPEDTLPFGKALLIGDTSDLPYEMATNFSVSGIRHIVAVSGLHVSILFGLFSVLCFGKGFSRAFLAFPILFLFAAVTGFTPSVSRACIMAGLMLLSSAFNREYDGFTALSFAGLSLLLVNPLVIVSISYQLSFASVAGIFLFGPHIRKWINGFFSMKKAGALRKRLRQWFALSVSITLSATVATVPLCAVYFGSVSLVSVVTNLLVLWVVSLIFYGLMGVCLLGSFWSAGAALLGKVISWPIRYVLLVSKIIGDFPLAAVYTRSIYIVFWLVFVYVLLAVFLMSRNKRPGVLFCCGLLGLCLSLLASWTEPMLDEVRFTVLDVGQGQCLLLQSQGKTFLVDCGGSSGEEAADIAAETLLSQGISSIDAVVLTHYDKDHAGGLQHLLTRVDAKLLILPPVYAEEPLEAEEILYAYEDLAITAADLKLTVYTSDLSGSDNENSLCVLFDTENCDILITGDRDGFGERMLLRNAEIPQVDILVAGHHGSKNATCEELLQAVSPETVCISAGKNNPFGHPAEELLQRLAEYGCRVYRTDLQGDIIIRR